jgi:hypothetical protein
VPGRATLCQVVPRCATRRRLGEHLGNAVVPRCARLCQVVPEGIAHSVAHSRQSPAQPVHIFDLCATASHRAAIRWSLMRDLANCYAATAVRPDGLSPR